MGRPSLWELFWGTWGEGSFARGHEGYERKALGMGISPYGGSVGYIIWATWSGLICRGL
jgi:hypothetical protein